MPVVFRNKLLSAIPRSEIVALEPMLEAVVLDRGRVMEAPQAYIGAIWFIEEGIASIFIEADRRKSVAVGMVGREGFVGASLLNGHRLAPTRTLVLMPGNAWRMDGADFIYVLRSCRALEDVVRRYHQSAIWQMAGTSLANARAGIQQRLARWLLMCHDRLEQSHIHITHDSIAAVLGVRRPGVTDALHVLEGEGLIRSIRLDIEIVDRARLERFAGGFYGMPDQVYDLLMPYERPRLREREPSALAMVNRPP